jgi:hypothetical protein
MEHSTLAIFVMLNNWFHDFTVAMLFCSLICLRIIYRRTRDQPNAVWLPFARDLAKTFNKVTYVCWAMLIVLGAIRTLAYRDFEWEEAAGSGQVAALVLKHVLLVSLVLWGTMNQLRLRKFFRESKV